ncbi:MAG: peptide ABC transporter substrate-binding protein [Betaproteobacteria bacterium]
MKRWLSLLVAMVMLLSLAAVPALAAPAPKAQQILRHPNGTEPETIDPAMSTGIPEANIELAVFEGLTRIGSNDQIVPGVAYKWEVSKDGKVYTFHLRKSKWSNGDPVTAHDFAYAWTRALRPETAAEYAYQLFYIKNAEEFNAGKIKDPSQLGIKVIDDYTLQVTLKAPTPFFTFLTGFPTLMPVHKKFVEADPKGWFTKPETYIGNGPFKLDKWEHNSKLELVKNPLYWDAKHVKLERIVLSLVDSNTTQEAMFETNQLDVLDDIPLPSLDRWKKDKGYEVTPYLGTYYYIINCNKIKDKRVRQALYLAIDRETLVEKILKGGQKPAYAFTPNGFPDPAKKGGDFRTIGGNFLTTGDFKKDVEKAKKLLAEAGHADGKGLSVEILYNTSESHKRIAEFIQQQWKTHLGIDNVKITNQEWKVYLDTRDTDNFDVARAGWIADYVHPLTFMDMHVTGGGNNDSKWGNKKYDELIDFAKNTADQKAAFKAMHEAEAIMMDEMPVIPLYFYTELHVFKPWVKNLTISSLGFWNFKEAWIEKH